MKVLVIGAGIMGRGIVYVAAARAELPVVCVDSNAKVLASSKDYVRRIAEREKRDPAELLSRIVWEDSLDRALQDKEISFVIEAVSENLELKRKIFANLVKNSAPKAILATNTSSIPITIIAESVAPEHRSRIIGMHFFNPVPRVTGMEVILTKYTSPEVMDETLAVARKMDRKVSVCKLDIAGFLVNRILNANLLEALNLLEQNAGTPQDIDEIMKNAAGFPIGPFKLTDMIGLDTAAAVAHTIFEQSGQNPRYKPSKFLDDMVKSGNLGMKTGKGFYTYHKL